MQLKISHIQVLPEADGVWTASAENVYNFPNKITLGRDCIKKLDCFMDRFSTPTLRGKTPQKMLSYPSGNSPKL